MNKWAKSRALSAVGVIGLLAISLLLYIDIHTDPLINAVIQKNIQRVNELIAIGHDVNVRNAGVVSPWRGWTPLAFAARDCNDAIVKTLVAAGANVEPSDNSVRPLCVVIGGGGRASVVELLIEHGAEVNKMCGDVPPLWLAVEIGDEEVAHLLLQAGAKTDFTDGRTGRRLDDVAREIGIDLSDASPY